MLEWPQGSLAVCFMWSISWIVWQPLQTATPLISGDPQFESDDGRGSYSESQWPYGDRVATRSSSYDAGAHSWSIPRIRRKWPVVSYWRSVPVNWTQSAVESSFWDSPVNILRSFIISEEVTRSAPVHWLRAQIESDPTDFFQGCFSPSLIFDILNFQTFRPEIEAESLRDQSSEFPDRIFFKVEFFFSNSRNENRDCVGTERFNTVLYRV